MTLILFSIILLVSLSLSCTFISREAKRFALTPPAPLIDLDRMYDKIFSSLDEEVGSAITPTELQKVLAAFVKVLMDRGIVAEDIKSGAVENEEELTPEQIAAEIRRENKDIGVAHIALIRVIEQSLTYLKDIHALS